MFHCLEIDGGHDSTKRFVVSPTGLRIGRAPPADIVLTDKQVSRSHCLVELADGGLRVSDLNSTNGTFIDGERISGPSQLGVGSLLRVGTVLMKHQVRTSRTLQESQVGA
jgi:pSer/pThr/pTyr-binding forkhead associated (FHA) protein